MKQLEAIFRLRVEAWKARVPHFPEMEGWSDAFDAAASHWAIYDGGRLVAAGRLTIHARLEEVPNPEVFAPLLPQGLAGPIGVLTRLVVAKSHAGQGLSKRLDRARIGHARRMGCRHLIGSTFAGEKREMALMALGFARLGEAGQYASGPLRDVNLGGGRKSFSPSGFDDGASIILGLGLHDGRLASGPMPPASQSP